MFGTSIFPFSQSLPFLRNYYLHWPMPAPTQEARTDTRHRCSPRHWAGRSELSSIFRASLDLFRYTFIQRNEKKAEKPEKEEILERFDEKPSLKDFRWFLLCILPKLRTILIFSDLVFFIWDQNHYKISKITIYNINLQTKKLTQTKSVIGWFKELAKRLDSGNKSGVWWLDHCVCLGCISNRSPSTLQYDKL